MVIQVVLAFPKQNVRCRNRAPTRMRLLHLADGNTLFFPSEAVIASRVPDFGKIPIARWDGLVGTAIVVRRRWRFPMVISDVVFSIGANDLR